MKKFKKLLMAKSALILVNTELKLIHWTEQQYKKDRRLIIDFDLMWEKIKAERLKEDILEAISELKAEK